MPRLSFCVVGVVLAGWEAEMHAVNESDLSLIICAVQIANIELDVIVTLTSSSQTAICELYANPNNGNKIFSFLVGMDYTLQVTSSVFASHQLDQRVCFDVGIVNDATLENDEAFQVFLTSPGLNIQPNTATVTIIDSNCKAFM